MAASDPYPFDVEPLACGRGSASAAADTPPAFPSRASPPDGVPASGAYCRISLVTARCPPREASAKGVWPSSFGTLKLERRVGGGKRRGGAKRVQQRYLRALDGAHYQCSPRNDSRKDLAGMS